MALSAPINAYGQIYYQTGQETDLTLVTGDYIFPLIGKINNENNLIEFFIAVNESTPYDIEINGNVIVSNATQGGTLFIGVKNNSLYILRGFGNFAASIIYDNVNVEIPKSDVQDTIKIKHQNQGKIKAIRIKVHGDIIDIPLIEFFTFPFIPPPPPTLPTPLNGLYVIDDNTFSIDLPANANTQAGDLIVVFVSTLGNITSFPSGFNLLTSNGLIDPIFGFTVTLLCYYKISDGTENILTFGQSRFNRISGQVLTIKTISGATATIKSFGSNTNAVLPHATVNITGNPNNELLLNCSTCFNSGDYTKPNDWIAQTTPVSINQNRLCIAYNNAFSIPSVESFTHIAGAHTGVQIGVLLNVL